MFSLPQEWLWCESWCSDASKAEAKTIDLCNNPQVTAVSIRSFWPCRPFGWGLIASRPTALVVVFAVPPCFVAAMGRSACLSCCRPIAVGG